jgi:hypothetical protein
MASGGYTDDPTILDDDNLWRRIPPCHFIQDDNVGGVRPSSAAFDDHPNGSPMSVVLESVAVQFGRGPMHVLAGHVGYALASVTAGLARQYQQGVAREPLADEPAHAVVFGNKTKRIKRELAKGSRWVTAPPSTH